MTDYESFRNELKARFQPREVAIERASGDFPHQIVKVPDEWPTVTLAPLYDVHIGHGKHDSARFQRHLRWLRDTPHVLTWNGGDLVDNSSKLSPGGSVYDQEMPPNEQFLVAMRDLAEIRHKMIFAIPGNHEDRLSHVGIDMAGWLAMLLEVPYFPDYAFTTIQWRGNNFRLLAHHGTGSAQTAGAQRMAARKDLSWAKPVDIIWTGHLHAPLADMVYQTDFDQTTGEMFERNAFVIIAPSYLKFFGTYAAKKRYAPGPLGLGVIVLQPDGRMDVSLHVNGRRL